MINLEEFLEKALTQFHPKIIKMFRDLLIAFDNMTQEERQRILIIIDKML